MDYGEILSRAWQIIWKHKILWIFGILASCGSGSNNLGNNSRYTNRGGPNPFDRWFGGISSEQMTMIIVVAVAVSCILFLLVTFLSTMGRIGLIRGASRADQDLETHLAFGDLFREGMGYFWRVFLLNLGLGLLALLLVIMLIAPVLVAGGVGLVAADGPRGAAAGLGAGMILFMFCLCCLLVPIFMLLGVILEMVYNAMLVEDLGIGAGIARGWQVFKANLGSIVLLWAILVLAIGLIGGFIIGAPLFLIALPALAGSMGGQGSTGIGLGISLICFVAYLPFLLALRGILTSYTESAWTVAYRRFIGLHPGQVNSGAGAQVFDLTPPDPLG